MKAARLNGLIPAGTIDPLSPYRIALVLFAASFGFACAIPGTNALPGAWSDALGRRAPETERRDYEVVPRSPEAAASAAFMHGHLLELEGSLHEAAEAYAKAAEIDPQAPELQRALLRIYSRLGQHELAAQHADQFLALDPSDPDARREVAMLYVLHQRYDDAVELLEPQFEAGELTPDAAYTLFNLYLEVGRLDAAERVARSLIELEPEGVRAYFGLGAALERQERFDEAARVYESARKHAPYDGRVYDAQAKLRRRVEDVDGELALLNEKLQVLPGDPTALLRIAQIREAQEDRLGATRALETLIHHHPGHLSAHFQLGYFYYEAGDYDEAIARFEMVAASSATIRDPQYVHEVSYFLALAYFEAERYGSVERALAEVPPAAERYADARVLSARALEREERYADALDHAIRAQDVLPDNVPIQVYVAGLMQRNDQLDEAVSIMGTLIKADPENVDLHYDLGLIYSNAGDEDRALESMIQVVERDADHASALNYVGYTWADRGKRLDEAEAMIVRAVELRPDDGYINDSLGWVRYKRGLQLLDEGRHEEARGAFESAIADLERARSLLDEDDPVITFHLGDAYRSASRFEDALAAYRRALELDPSGKDAPEIRKRIELLELQTGQAGNAPDPLR